MAKREEKEIIARTFSEQDIKEIEALITQYGGKDNVLKDKGVMRFGDFMRVIQNDGFIGERTGVGSHTYTTDIGYDFWQEAFRAYDRHLEKKIWVDAQRIYNLTGQYPVNEAMQNFMKNVRGILKYE